VVLAAFPVYYIVVTSLKTQADYLKPPPWAFPEKWTLENYRAVLESGFLRYFSNSVWVATTVAIASVALSLLVAYGVVRSSSRVFRGSFYLFILGFAIPAQATVISLYTLARSVGLYDTLWAITLPLTGFAMPVTVIVFSNFLREIPPALFEAMAIEGAGHLTILRHLVLPLSLRAVLSMGLFNFIGAWNALLFPTYPHRESRGKGFAYGGLGFYRTIWHQCSCRHGRCNPLRLAAHRCLCLRPKGNLKRFAGRLGLGL